MWRRGCRNGTPCETEKNTGVKEEDAGVGWEMVAGGGGQTAAEAEEQWKTWGTVGVGREQRVSVLLYLIMLPSTLLAAVSTRFILRLENSSVRTLD